MHPESLERFVLVTQFFSAPVISFSRSYPIHNDPGFPDDLTRDAVSGSSYGTLDILE